MQDAYRLRLFRNGQEILCERTQGAKDTLNGMLALFPGALIFQGTFLGLQDYIDFVFELRIGGVYWFTLEFREIKGSPFTFITSRTSLSALAAFRYCTLAR
jgi:hypothetical protein